ncbi:hypothetical protein [Kamptonema formosum]|uniref:hypothetical protein n=1 Tax=Kamptonema formosum TaxID=331992 RepID=UPI000344E6EE|nr:hypothetical protein [Oscillatoria sp. PCC 10802]
MPKPFLTDSQTLAFIVAQLTVPGRVPVPVCLTKISYLVVDKVPVICYVGASAGLSGKSAGWFV